MPSSLPLLLGLAFRMAFKPPCSPRAVALGSMDSVIGSLTLIGAAAGVSKPAGELLKSLLEKLLGPAADLAGSSLRDFFERRQARAVEVLESAVEILQQGGHDVRPVPGRILWPL